VAHGRLGITPGAHLHLRIQQIPQGQVTTAHPRLRHHPDRLLEPSNRLAGSPKMTGGILALWSVSSSIRRSPAKRENRAPPGSFAAHRLADRRHRAPIRQPRSVRLLCLQATFNSRYVDTRAELLVHRAERSARPSEPSHCHQIDHPARQCARCAAGPSRGRPCRHRSSPEGGSQRELANMTGRTERAILAETLALHGILNPESKFDDFYAALATLSWSPRDLAPALCGAVRAADPDWGVVPHDPLPQRQELVEMAQRLRRGAECPGTHRNGC
jgi:hypothetical protein